MRRASLLGLLMVALVAGYAPAQAATITRTVDFTATGFAPPGAPINPVTGSFTITFDPTVNTLFDTTHITKNSLNINSGGLAFGYFAGSDVLFIGGQLLGLFGVAPGTNDFLLAIAGFLNGPQQQFFAYSQQGQRYDYFARSVEISSVPLPPSLLLMMSALGGLGLLAWHRSRRARTA